MRQQIVYVSWPPSEITGGIKLIFRHVEMLNESGFSASVATESAQAPTWFRTTAPIVDLGDVSSANTEFVVLPENNSVYLQRFSEFSSTKIVYCQNQFTAHRGLMGAASYADFGISAVIALGHAGASFCCRRFPRLPVFHVPPFVDSNTFSFARDKKLQIAAAPRKRPLEYTFVRDLLAHSFAHPNQVAWVTIDDLTEAQLAGVLRESAIYLSLQRFESVGMSALEAMASGCIVTGFTGFGGNEYATSANGFWVPEDDCEQCATRLIDAIELLIASPPYHAEIVRNGVETARRYDYESLKLRLTEIWTQLVS